MTSKPTPEPELPAQPAQPDQAENLIAGEVAAKPKKSWIPISVGAGLIVLVGIGFAISQTQNNSSQSDTATDQAEESQTGSYATANTSSSTSTTASWSYNGKSWQVSGVPPTCPDPLLAEPVDIDQVEAILYPGQERGGNYKAHGGFNMIGTSNMHDVKMPIDGKMTRAVRYIEMGEVQYMFEFQNPCGVAVRFDHLLTLAPDFQTIADALPEAKVDDTRSDFINDGPEFKLGDLVATEVGFKQNGNNGFDFGVYDYRQTNQASQDQTFAAAHQDFGELIYYGVCWLDKMPAADISVLKALPAGDGKNGKTSDYCN